MNEKDKEAVKAAKGTTTPKVPKSKSQQGVEAGGEQIVARLQQQSKEAGLALADNFQSHALMVMIQQMESGAYGPRTAAILAALEGGNLTPLESWSNQIQAWHEPPILTATVESIG